MRKPITDRLIQFLRGALDSSQVVTQRSRYRLLDCVWLCRHTRLPPAPLVSRWVGPKHNYRNAQEGCQLRIGRAFRPAHVGAGVWPHRVDVIDLRNRVFPGDKDSEFCQGRKTKEVPSALCQYIDSHNYWDKSQKRSNEAQIFLNIADS